MSVRHKQVLDVAENQPDASLEEIAADIPSATVEYVESVLDEYGDPAEAEAGAAGEDEDRVLAENEEDPPNESGVNDERGDFPLPDLEDLTEKQQRLLRTIDERPEATQQELADQLDVSAPTISNRVNDIDGFDWAERKEIANTLINTDQLMQIEHLDNAATDGSGTVSSNDQLENRVTELEQRVEDLSGHTETNGVLDDTELVHKVIHACLKSDTITEEEELQILGVLVT